MSETGIVRPITTHLKKIRNEAKKLNEFHM